MNSERNDVAKLGISRDCFAMFCDNNLTGDRLFVASKYALDFIAPRIFLLRLD
ncbi:hypothetical protein [Nostoc sp. CHAB 5715]|uniref:hypothetical protein n=1 Tax=Nostoc sp. CHAB 5715 TaxID=2780400 RepID=UPI001E2E739F|nr:hypothetical protein [Nostoc sp. CHAB 5715]MCC5621638.1 hypothetical protein [Nostoc sp. CHAB 5715]